MLYFSQFTGEARSSNLLDIWVCSLQKLEPVYQCGYFIFPKFTNFYTSIFYYKDTCD